MIRVALMMEADLKFSYPRRVRHNRHGRSSARRFQFSLDSIESSTELERSSFLHGLHLEEIIDASVRDDRLRRQNWGAVSDSLDPRGRFLHLFEIDTIRLFSHDSESLGDKRSGQQSMTFKSTEASSTMQKQLKCQ